MNKILLTGGGGFLGSLIRIAFRGNDIHTLGRFNSDINTDLSNQIPNILNSYQLVIHAAGRAHSVPQTADDKQEFFNVNVIGTVNLLNALENSALPRSFVFISTVAVYGKESGHLIDENESLSAKDPYGQSKILAEEIISKWCSKHDVICTILRLPLIAGPNPPGNLGSMIKGIQKGYYFNIGGGRAKKSIVLAEDVARIIPKAAEIGGIFNLTDGYHPSFKELSSVIAEQLNKKTPASIPGLLAKTMAMIGDMFGIRAPINTVKLKKITSDLTFDDSKARKLLGWNPTPVLDGFRVF
ncbi:MAG: NAD-dependent epimerase/dehydratase family protein [Pyrinomonadaceae bacterium]|nr:NAD-dependent epimerase/dehydratase family protein [Sphingobacteriaceae bacterium]